MTTNHRAARGLEIGAPVGIELVACRIKNVQKKGKKKNVLGQDTGSDSSRGGEKSPSDWVGSDDKSRLTFMTLHRWLTTACSKSISGHLSLLRSSLILLEQTHARAFTATQAAAEAQADLTEAQQAVADTVTQVLLDKVLGLFLLSSA